MGGDFSMNKKEEQELNERLNRIEQHERLRKAEGKEQYKDTSKEIESLSIQMINLSTASISAQAQVTSSLPPSV